MLVMLMLVGVFRDILIFVLFMAVVDYEVLEESTRLSDIV